MTAGGVRPPRFEDFKNSGQFSEEQLMQIQQELAQQQQLQQQQQQLMVPQQQQDPFASDQYRQVNMPEVPVAFRSNMAEQLLSNDEVPEDIRAEFWNIFHKDNVLTFLDEKRQVWKMLAFDIQKIDILNTLPYYNYTFDKELLFGVLRNTFETKLDRAVGFTGTATKNERIVLQSQFTQHQQIQESTDGQNMIREGFFKRLLRRK